jgi:hypothetical protein
MTPKVVPNPTKNGTKKGAAVLDQILGREPAGCPVNILVHCLVVKCQKLIMVFHVH